MVHSRRPRRAIGWLVLLFRVLAVVASFQVSGAAHLLGDAVEMISLGHHSVDDDHESDPNHRCPPGCPTCHHVHAGNVSLPVHVASPVSWVPLIEGVVTLLSYDGTAPPAPDPTSLYRPPRSTSLDT